MKYGYIYILTNVEVPNLIKIGYTERSPKVRAKELSRDTGVADKWEHFASWKLSDASHWETKIFSELARYRDTKEFFKLSPKKAKDLVIIFLQHSGAFGYKKLSPSHENEVLESTKRNKAYAEELNKNNVDIQWSQLKEKLDPLLTKETEKVVGSRLDSLNRTLDTPKTIIDSFVDLLALPVFIVWWFCWSLPSVCLLGFTSLFGLEWHKWWPMGPNLDFLDKPTPLQIRAREQRDAYFKVYQSKLETEGGNFTNRKDIRRVGKLELKSS